MEKNFSGSTDQEPSGQISDTDRPGSKYMDSDLCIYTSTSVYYCRTGSLGIKEKTLMDGKNKKLVIALILVILAGLAYLFLLRYSDKQKEAESQKEQEEAAASFVFETDTDEVSSISFSGDDGILTFEKE